MEELSVIEKIIQNGLPMALMIAVIGLWRENQKLQAKIDKLTGIAEQVKAMVVKPKE